MMYEAGEPARAIAARLGRTKTSVLVREKIIGLPPRRIKSTSRPWSSSDIKTLRTLYEAGEPARAIATRLGRTVGTVRLRAKIIGLPSRWESRHWSSTEVATLHRMYEAGDDYRIIAAELGRTVRGVETKARLLNFPLRPRFAPWSHLALANLRALYEAGDSVKDIARTLGRSEAAIRSRLSLLRLSDRRTRWSSRELIKLRKLHEEKVPLDCIARELGRTTISITDKIRAAGYRLNHAPAGWDESDICNLRRYHEAGLSIGEIAGKLPGKSYHATARALEIYGIRRCSPRRIISDTEAQDILNRHAAGETLGQIASGVGASESLVSKFIRGYGAKRKQWQQDGVTICPLGDADKEVIEREFLAGRLVWDIARELNRNPGVIWRYIRRIDLSRDEAEEVEAASGPERKPCRELPGPSVSIRELLERAGR